MRRRRDPQDVIRCRAPRASPLRGAPRVSLIARSGAKSCTFRTGQHSGVWFVTKDHAFYGDYLSRAQALAAARAGAEAMEAQGATAQVFEAPDDAPAGHRRRTPDPET